MNHSQFLTYPFLRLFSMGERPVIGEVCSEPKVNTPEHSKNLQFYAHDEESKPDLQCLKFCAKCAAHAGRPPGHRRQFLRLRNFEILYAKHVSRPRPCLFRGILEWTYNASAV